MKLYDRQAFPADAGTVTIPIKRTHQIADLVLEVRATNGANHNAADNARQQEITEAIQRIKLQSGSKVYYDTSGEMNMHYNAYRSGKYPAELHDQGDAAIQEQTFPIPFGIDPGDDEMSLPAPLMDSLDMVIDYDFTIDADAGFATGTGYYSIYAWVWPAEPVNVMEDKSFLVCEKKHDWTTLAAGDHNFDMTLDERRMLRQIICWCYENEIGEGVDITDVGLKVDSELIAEYSWCELQKQNANDCNLTWERLWHLHANTANDEIWTRVPEPTVQLTSSQATAFITVVADSVTVTVNAADDTTDMLLKSERIPGTVVLDFDRNKSMRHLQPQGVRDIDFIISQGGAGGDVDVLEQSVMKYW